MGLKSLKDATVWCRWSWADTGPGRWHVLGAIGLGGSELPEVVIFIATVCGSVRPIEAEFTIAGGEPRCPECAATMALKVPVTQNISLN